MGGYDGSNVLSSVELFPPSDSCFIPVLPQPRSSHSLSLLSGGRLVVCGGYNNDYLDSCISWVAGNTSWTHFHTMRCLPIIPHNLSSLKNTITVWREVITRPGRRPLFLTPLSCSADMAMHQSSLQRLCQVCIRKKCNLFLFPHRRCRL